MTRSLSAFVGVATCALVLGCETPSAPKDIAALGLRLAAWQPDSGATLAHEYYSGDVGAQRTVVANAFTWAAVWAQVYGDNSSPPAVDFGTDRVLVAALGQHATGGFDIRIDSIAQFEHGTVAYVTTVAPGSSCFTTAALTQPVHILRVPADLAQDVMFEDQVVVHECS